MELSRLVSNMVALVGDSRVHVAVSAFARELGVRPRLSALSAQRSTFNFCSPSSFHSVILSPRWSRSRPCVALYITGRSTFPLHFLIICAVLLA
jgi:hypothetical protein